MAEKTKAVAKPSVLGIMATKYNLDQATFLSTIKATVMKPGRDNKVASNEEIAAFLMVANKYNLDPFTNEIYAFPSKKGGVVPIVGVDGFVTIMNRQPDYNGYEMIYSTEDSTMEGAKSCPEWAEVKIYHKDREHATIVREYLDEVYVPARNSYSGPWQSHTKRMLRHKVLIQGIRIAFGITGIYDPDEGNRILDAQTVESGKPEVEMPKAIETTPDKPETVPDATKEKKPTPTAPTQEQADLMITITEAFETATTQIGVDFIVKENRIKIAALPDGCKEGLREKCKKAQARIEAKAMDALDE